MKKIIDGKLCDTSTAKEIGYKSYGQYGSFEYECRTLYRTKSGVYFIHGEGGAMSAFAVQKGANEWSGGEKIEIVSAEYAKKWAEENLSAEEYEAEFGETREFDTVAITVYLPADIVSKLDEIKAKTGMARTAIVEKLVRNGLKNQ